MRNPFSRRTTGAMTRRSIRPSTSSQIRGRSFPHEAADVQLERLQPTPSRPARPERRRRSGIRQPYLDQYILGFDREVFRGIVVSGTLVYRRSADFIEIVSRTASSCPFRGRSPGPGNRSPCSTTSSDDRRARLRQPARTSTAHTGSDLLPDAPDERQLAAHRLVRLFSGARQRRQPGF